MPPPHVFICYAHESPAFRAQVKALAEWLREHGIEVVTDHPYEDKAPRKGWRAWMQHGIEDAALVLVVCTPGLKARHEKRAEAGVGRGATYEGAIIQHTLYAASQHNEKFVPVLPDNGDPADIPVVLADFDAGHRFPSGNERLLRLIREELGLPFQPPAAIPVVPVPAAPPSPSDLPHGLLQGADDPRLRPREGKVYGRDDEIAQVLAFLRSREDGAVVYAAQVTGAGGIGKTEVCKAALKCWLEEAPGQRAFYVDVPDGAGAGELLYVVGRALGAPNVATFEELRPLLREGLYYLDNLEGVAQTGEGRQALQRLGEAPGVRVLASSRVSLPRELGQPIRVGALPVDDALALFRDLWTGEALDDAAALRRFVEDDLGCHALSLTLMARLGESYGFTELVERWRRKGTALAADALGGKTRQDSLRVSLALTAEALRQAQPQALALWTLAALFPDGLDAAALAAFEASLELPDQTRQLLARHHVWSRGGDGRFHVLAPVGRFALDEAVRESGGFSWKQVKSCAFDLFTPLLKKASSIASTEESLAARREAMKQFDAIARLLEIEAMQTSLDISLLDRINSHLLNLYQFRGAQARDLLQVLLPKLSHPAHATGVLGDLEVRLGRPEVAQCLYEKAIQLSRRENNLFAQANNLEALGSLKSRSGHIDAARRLYEQALELFEQEKSNLGKANTLEELGNLEFRIGHFDTARTRYKDALKLFKQERSGIGQANILRSLGELEGHLGQTDLARHLFDEALHLFEQEQVQIGQANTLKSIGELEVQRGRYDAARGLYERALDLFRLEEDGLGQANTLQSLGSLEYGSGSVAAALACYTQALMLYASAREPVGSAYTWAEVARCHHAQAQTEQRDMALVEAGATAAASNAEPVQRYVADVLVELTGSPEAAKAWLEQHFPADTPGD